MDDPNNQQQILSEFLSATDADADTAQALLQVADWDIQQAVSLYFAQYDNPQQPATNGTGSPVLQSGGSGEVRAPIAQKVEKLYDDEAPFRPAIRHVGGRGENLTTQVDAFRDFAYERTLGQGVGARQPVGSQPSSSSNRANGGPVVVGVGIGGGGAGAVADGGESSASLADMYKAPVEITWKGTFDEALQAAQGKDRWLIAYSSQSLTQQLMANYNISEQQLPVIIIIDPLTRQKMKDWSGFVPVDKLMEGLVPYMDHSPRDPEAHKLAQSAAQRTLQEDVRQNRTTSTAMDEDESLQAAIAASLQAHNTGFQDVTHGMSNSEFVDLVDAPLDMDVEDDAEIVTQKKSPEEIQREALASVPPEPAAEDENNCRVAFRWPDGKRTQRRFLKSDKVRDIRNFCISQVLATASGTQFQLLHNYPGSEAISDEEQTLQEAGVANAMIVMKLLD